MYYDFNNKNIIQGILMSWTSEAAKGLGWNIIGLLAIVSWTGINCFFMFFTLKKMGQLRVEPEQEFKGECTLAQNQLNQQTESQPQSVVKFCFQPTWSNNSDLAGVPQNKNNASMQKISLKVTFKIW